MNVYKVEFSYHLLQTSIRNIFAPFVVTLIDEVSHAKTIIKIRNTHKNNRKHNDYLII